MILAKWSNCWSIYFFYWITSIAHSSANIATQKRYKSSNFKSNFLNLALLSRSIPESYCAIFDKEWRGKITQSKTIKTEQFNVVSMLGKFNRENAQHVLRGKMKLMNNDGRRSSWKNQKQKRATRSDLKYIVRRCMNEWYNREHFFVCFIRICLLSTGVLLFFIVFAPFAVLLISFFSYGASRWNK